MRRSASRDPATGRRLLVAFVLAVVVLLAVHPLPVSADQSGGASAATADGSRVALEPAAGQWGLPGGLSLASIFPFAHDRETPERTDREVVELTDERSDALLDALAAGTAREVLRRLLEEPRTPSELAEEVDTSLQNVHYHVENLREAGAVEEVGVEYSSRGREMSVYAATCRPRLLVYDVE